MCIRHVTDARPPDLWPPSVGLASHDLLLQQHPGAAACGATVIVITRLFDARGGSPRRRRIGEWRSDRRRRRRRRGWRGRGRCPRDQVESPRRSQSAKEKPVLLDEALLGCIILMRWPAGAARVAGRQDLREVHAEHAAALRQVQLPRQVV